MKSKLSTQLQVELLLQIGAEILMHSNPYPYKRRHICMEYPKVPVGNW